jgi:hypothetical protein
MMAALPQVLTTGALYLILEIATLVISLCTPSAPFTLADILMMHLIKTGHFTVVNEKC